MSESHAMRLFTFEPLGDARWSRFVDHHPRASVFHTQAWLEALERTYGYEPIVYTTSPPSEELTNGLVFCKIDSWLTGRRLVSLPFSDHCEPLVDNSSEWEFLITSVIESARWEGRKTVELRPLTMGMNESDWLGMARSDSFYLHTIDLRREIGEIFNGFHKSCVQRKLKRAEREGISCVAGRSPDLIREFYRLLTATRRRHQLPPQPLRWFENLVDRLGDMLTIRVARKDGRSIASILTLSFKNQVYYKYGCSDQRFHNLGGVQLLLWQAIQEAKEQGAHVVDLGRSDIDQESLASFKDRWGGTRSPLHYYRHPPSSQEHLVRKWTAGIARHAFARLPNSLLTTAGRILYPHIG